MTHFWLSHWSEFDGACVAECGSQRVELDSKRLADALGGENMVFNGMHLSIREVCFSALRYHQLSRAVDFARTQMDTRV